MQITNAINISIIINYILVTETGKTS